jgi:hypothetical protein
VVHAAKQAEMFADSPIIVKLHQKIVVSYMSVEAIEQVYVCISVFQ